jgi:ribosome-binding factor A
VSAVDVSRDLAYADVYITILGKNDDDERKQTLDILTRGGGFLRSKLARAMKLRIVPALRFRYDESIERGVYLSNLIEDARKKDQAYNTSPDSGEE